METAKLTLRPTKEVIELAREMAKEDNTSITQMFSSFILSRSRRKKNRTEMEIPAGPLTQSLTGIVKVHADWDYKKEMEDILSEKYGLMS